MKNRKKKCNMTEKCTFMFNKIFEKGRRIQINEKNTAKNKQASRVEKKQNIALN